MKPTKIAEERIAFTKKRSEIWTNVEMYAGRWVSLRLPFTNEVWWPWHQ